MLYALPDDLWAATLSELPPRWFLDLRCACQRTGSHTVLWLGEHRTWSIKVGTIITRARCVKCRQPPLRAELREAAPVGGGGVGWQARLVRIPIPQTLPKAPEPEVEQIEVDWSFPGR